MDYKLSILICSINTREKQLEELLENISNQIKEGGFGDFVEVIALSDCGYKKGGMNVGGKRNRLLDLAHGKYICFIDDDDMISHDYIKQILKGINHNPDVITFEGWVTDNKMSKKNKFYIGTEHIAHDANGICYRFPNHLSPVKKEIAMQCRFPDKNFGEDSDYSDKLRQIGLTNEYKIPLDLYYYRFDPKLSAIK